LGPRTVKLLSARLPSGQRCWPSGCRMMPLPVGRAAIGGGGEGVANDGMA